MQTAIQPAQDKGGLKRKFAILPIDYSESKRKLLGALEDADYELLERQGSESYFDVTSTIFRCDGDVYVRDLDDVVHVAVVGDDFRDTKWWRVSGLKSFLRTIDLEKLPGMVEGGRAVTRLLSNRELEDI